MIKKRKFPFYVYGNPDEGWTLKEPDGKSALADWMFYVIFDSYEYGIELYKTTVEMEKGKVWLKAEGLLHAYGRVLVTVYGMRALREYEFEALRSKAPEKIPKMEVPCKVIDYGTQADKDLCKGYTYKIGMFPVFPVEQTE